MSINLFPMLMLPSWFRPTFCVKWTSVNKSYWRCYLALNHFQYSFQNCISKRKTNQAMSLRKLFHVAIYLRITSTYLWHKGPLWCHTYFIHLHSVSAFLHPLLVPAILAFLQLLKDAMLIYTHTAGNMLLLLSEITFYCLSSKIFVPFQCSVRWLPPLERLLCLIQREFIPFFSLMP